MMHVCLQGSPCRFCIQAQVYINIINTYFYQRRSICYQHGGYLASVTMCPMAVVVIIVIVIVVIFVVVVYVNIINTYFYQLRSICYQLGGYLASEIATKRPYVQRPQTMADDLSGVLTPDHPLHPLTLTLGVIKHQRLYL